MSWLLVKLFRFFCVFGSLSKTEVVYFCLFFNCPLVHTMTLHDSCFWLQKAQRRQLSTTSTTASRTWPLSSSTCWWPSSCTPSSRSMCSMWVRETQRIHIQPFHQLVESSAPLTLNFIFFLFLCRKSTGRSTSPKPNTVNLTSQDNSVPSTSSLSAGVQASCSLYELSLLFADVIKTLKKMVP